MHRGKWNIYGKQMWRKNQESCLLERNNFCMKVILFGLLYFPSLYAHFHYGDIRTMKLQRYFTLAVLLCFTVVPPNLLRSSPQLLLARDGAFFWARFTAHFHFKLPFYVTFAFYPFIYFLFFVPPILSLWKERKKAEFKEWELWTWLTYFSHAPNQFYFTMSQNIAFWVTYSTLSYLFPFSSRGA